MNPNSPNIDSIYFKKSNPKRLINSLLNPLSDVIPPGWAEISWEPTEIDFTAIHTDGKAEYLGNGIAKTGYGFNGRNPEGSLMFIGFGRRDYTVEDTVGQGSLRAELFAVLRALEEIDEVQFPQICIRSDNKTVVKIVVSRRTTVDHLFPMVEKLRVLIRNKHPSTGDITVCHNRRETNFLADFSSNLRFRCGIGRDFVYRAHGPKAIAFYRLLMNSATNSETIKYFLNRDCNGPPYICNKAKSDAEDVSDAEDARQATMDTASSATFIQFGSFTEPLVGRLGHSQRLL